MDDDVASAVEAELASLSLRLTEPASRECLRCYLMRMISEFSCDGTHRWTVLWRDRRAPQARNLVARIQGERHCNCDCEVLANAFPDEPERGLLPCAGIPRTGPAMQCNLRSARRTA
jgi:Protein of unknown function (DUF2695)